MCSKPVAIVLGILSFIPPFNGLLRFYLKRPVSGVLFTATAGFVWIGNILDIVQIPDLVRDANRRIKRREILRELPDDPTEEEPARRLSNRTSEKRVERVVLLSAKRHDGYTTPSEVALEGDISIEEARKTLDYLVSQGFVEMKVSKSGVVAYYLPDLLGQTPEQFEDL
jgi:hypothetical protein